ncbi:ATP-binding protein [Halobacteriovorax sp. HLS]|uniref:sensor histidine kinase n=1 Tax=Halobacteriovorax sp. HLS TaxID=2234000 RepID=UPI000FDAAC41|nr:ATP-binding protein [Halobacteriovorax sp. HLS]
MISKSIYEKFLSTIPWRYFKKIAISQLFLMLFIVFTTAITSRYYIKVYITNQSKNQLIESIELIKHSLITQGIEPLKWCQSLKMNWKTRYTLIHSSGKVVCDNYLDIENLDNHLDRPEVQEALVKEVGTSIRYSESTNYDMIYGAGTISHPITKTFYIIRQSVPLSEISIAMKKLDRSIALFLIPLLLVSAFISLYTSIQVASPLKSLLKKISEFENLTITSKHFESSLTIDDEWHFVERTLDKAEDQLEKFIGELQLQNKKFSILMDSISDSILAIDKDGRVLFINKRYIKTFGNSHNKDAKDTKLVELTRSIEIQRIFNQCLSEKKVVKLRSVELRTTSSNAWFDLTTSPLIGENNEILGAVCSFNNISDRKLADQMREDFVTNVSHEVRTPLTAMKGYVQILSSQKELQSNELTKEALEKIEHNSNRLTVLFQEILNLSLIESLNKINKTEIIAEDISSQVLANLRLVHPQKSKKIETIINVEKLWADPNLLEQVLTNLIDNIYKYGNDNGLIRISWNKEASNIILIIEDDGPGIDSKHHGRVFERFYRVDSSRSSQLGGTGLGLSIVKHIIQKHQGDIKISSNSLGGTSFRVILPQKSPF